MASRTGVTAATSTSSSPAASTAASVSVSAQGTGTGTTANVPQKPPRILACVLCQHRKIKCDRNFPCANCVKVGRRKGARGSRAFQSCPTQTRPDPDLNQLNPANQLLASEANRLAAHSHRQMSHALPALRLPRGNAGGRIKISRSAWRGAKNC